jgi:hypothetical protein
MKVLLLISILTLSSCSFFESDYERLIKDVRAQKLKEKQQRIPNPVFEGITEPDFPNEEENNKTFEGVDANKDGIRDDIEIWINRISEDKEVRIATKHYYKMRMTFLRGVLENSTVEKNTNNHVKSGDALFCLLKSFGKRRNEFLTSNHLEIETVRIDEMFELLHNNILRKNVFQKSEYIKLNPYVIDPEKKYNNCSKDNDLNYLKKEW